MSKLPAIPVTATNMPEWVRRAATTINNLLSQMNNLASATDVSDLKALVVSKSGWANYADTGAAQAITADTRTVWTNNAGTKDEEQKPTDVDRFWDDTVNKLPGRDGDAIAIRFQMVFTPADATASMLVVEVDVGGAIGVVDALSFPIVTGAGVPQHISWNVLAFQRATWVANGGTVFVTADGPGTITAKRVLVSRMHKANPDA